MSVNNSTLIPMKSKLIALGSFNSHSITEIIVLGSIQDELDDDDDDDESLSVEMEEILSVRRNTI